MSRPSSLTSFREENLKWLVALREVGLNVDVGRIRFEPLRSFLMDKRDLVMRLPENPNLLEHESLTDLLSAILHLREELSYRINFTKLPETDIAHSANDTERAYTFLVHCWLDYVQHLGKSYPCLFSLVVRVIRINLTPSNRILLKRSTL